MATAAYPTQIRSFADKVDEVDIVYADHVNLLQVEVEALQTELGTDPAGAFTDVKTFLSTLNSNKYEDGSTVKAGSGTAGIPGLGFSAEAGLGFFRGTAGAIDLTSGGVRTFRFRQASSGGETYDIIEGSELNEQIQFRHNADAIDLVTTNVTRMTVSNGGVNVVGDLDVSSDIEVNGTPVITSARRLTPTTGSAGAPSHSFDGDTDSGMYRVASNQIGLATQGNQRLLVKNSGVFVTASYLRAGSGSGSSGNETPGLSFNSHPEVGWQSASNNVMYAIADKKRIFAVTNNDVQMYRKIMLDDGSSALRFRSNDSGIERRTAGSGGFTMFGNGNNVAVVAGDGSSFSPADNGTIDLGTNGLRWKQLYASTSTISTSDERVKTDIIPSDIGLDWVLGVTPRRYRKKDGVRPHYGFVAQEIKTVMDSLGLHDFAGFIDAEVKPPTDTAEDFVPLMGLRYEEFIAPLYKGVQDLHGIVEEDREYAERLEARIVELEKHLASRSS